MATNARATRERTLTKEVGSKREGSMGCELISTSRSMVPRTSDCVDALGDVASEVFGINRDAVDRVIQLKGDISSNVESFKLVEDQFKNTKETLHFMDNFKCFHISKIRDMVLLFLAADGSSGAEVIQKLKEDIKGTNGEPVANMRLIFEDYDQTFSRQSSVLHKLHLRKNKLDDKLRKVKAWRKAWNIVYYTIRFAVIVLSVVLALLAAPLAATVVTSGANGVMGLVEPWVDSKWDEYQSPREFERELTEKILNEASLTFYGVKHVGFRLSHLKVEIATLTNHVELNIEEDEDATARMVVERMKAKAAVVMENVESLENQVDRRREELRRTALTFLQSVTDQVENFHNGESNIPV